MGRHPKLLIVRYSPMRRNCGIFLQTFSSSLYLESLIFNLKLVECFDCLVDSSLVLVLKKGIALINSDLCIVFNQVE